MKFLEVELELEGVKIVKIKVKEVSKISKSFWS